MVCSNAYFETRQKMTGHKCTIVRLTFTKKTLGAVIGSYTTLGALEPTVKDISQLSPFRAIP